MGVPEETPSQGVRPRALALGFAILAAVTFCLIVFGALVRANNAGLACPDWPLCFGELVPRFDIKVAFEWGHRLLASFVSLGLAVLTWLSSRNAMLRARLKQSLVFAWVVLVTQVVFGGLTVLLKLAPWTVTVHLILGNTFCLILLWVARDLFECERGVERQPLPSAVRGLMLAVAGLLFLQLVLGGLVSSNYAGLACTSFPTCNGEHVVPQLSGLVGLHVIHRLNGALLLIGYSLLAWRTKGLGVVGLLARFGARLVFLQIFVGVASVLMRLPPEVTGLHTGTAAAIVLLTAMAGREVLLSGSESKRVAASARMAEA